MADGNAYSHPGVYIHELPGIPTISSVSTSIPVFVGQTQTLDPADRYVARQVKGWADYRNRYGDYVWGAEVSKAVYEFFAEGGALCYVIGVNSTTQLAAAGNKSVQDLTGSYAFNAASAGEWGNLLYISFVDAAPVPPKKASNYFNVNVLVSALDVDGVQPTVATRLLKQYITDNSIKPVNGYYVIESFGSFTFSSIINGGVNGILCKLVTQINAKSIFIRVAGVKPNTTLSLTTSRAGKGIQLSAGKAFDLSNYGGAWPALASVADATLVAVPDAAVVDMTASGGDDVKKYKTNIIRDGVLQACENLPNLFYVIDPPYVGTTINATTGQAIDNSQNIVDFVLGTSDNLPLSSNENAAVYYPWPVVLNPISGTNVPVPPCGPVLGCIARTDINAGVHYSPAGVANGQIKTATGMTKWLGESDQDSCNPHGINVIRNIPGYGITIYGARTLAVGTEWQYVAVRRFVTFVELSLKAGLQWVVFEPSTDFLWTTIIREVTAFLSLLWNEGALFGATPEEAFFVTCDETNNTPAHRTQGVLNVDVGLAVLYPVEFVVIRIAQITSAPSSGS